MITSGNKYYNSLIKAFPKDWKIVSLRTLGTFQKGKGILKDQVVESGLPCIRYGEIYTRHNYVIKRFYSFIQPEVAKESQKITANSVLFAGSGETLEEIGKAVAFNGKGEAYAGGDVIILSLNGRMLASYLSYTLNTNFLNWQKRRLGQGHSVVHIYPSDLAHLLVPVPTIEEQKRIVTILSTWDKAIELTEQLISKKEKQKRALAWSLLSGRKTIPGCTGKWQKLKLGQCVNGKGEYGINAPAVSFSNSLPRYLRITDITDDGRYSNKDAASVASPEYKQYILSENDIVFARTGSSTGKTYLYNKNDGELTFAGFLIRFSPNPEILNPKYLKFFTETASYWNWVKMMSSRSGQPGINSREYSELPLFLPPIHDQNRIEDILSICDREIQLLKSEVETLKTKKKGLIEKLMIGKKE
jgi:type I restriction enzyme S subunit